MIAITGAAALVAPTVAIASENWAEIAAKRFAWHGVYPVANPDDFSEGSKLTRPGFMLLQRHVDWYEPIPDAERGIHALVDNIVATLNGGKLKSFTLRLPPVNGDTLEATALSYGHLKMRALRFMNVIYDDLGMPMAVESARIDILFESPTV